MFPKLSEKALGAMREHYNITPIGKTSACDFEIVDAFTSLFDLKKYPITREMLFDYLKSHKGFYDERLKRIKQESTPAGFEFALWMREYCKRPHVC